MDFDWNKALAGELGEDLQENTQRCKEIADDLKKIADGAYCRPEDEDDGTDMGLWIDTPEEGVPEGYVEVTIDDYLDENYGVRTTISDDGEVFSTSVCVAWGGPNIYIDTGSGAVEMYWWSTRCCYPIPGSVANMIDDWAQERFKMNFRRD